VVLLILSLLAGPVPELLAERPTAPGFALAGLRSFELLPPQDPFNIKELAEYRLTDPVFRQFVHASQLIVTATRENTRLASEPLFTRDILIADDAAAAAAQLEARLKFEPRYTAALRIASLSAHDYAKFALALFAARLAHGFLQSGAMRRVPAGAATDNVAFIAAHESEVSDLLRSLGVEP
jgi:hypothetical protein